MASSLKNLSSYDPQSVPSGKGKKVAIIVAEWNEEITFSLHNACYDTLLAHGCEADDLITQTVPGAFELTTAATWQAQIGKADAIICLGCVIKGETSHNEYINHAVAQGLTKLSVKTGIPCIFGVLTPNSQQQALDRSGGKHGNKGVEAAITALKMMALKNQL